MQRMKNIPEPLASRALHKSLAIEPSPQSTDVDNHPHLTMASALRTFAAAFKLLNEIAPKRGAAAILNQVFVRFSLLDWHPLWQVHT